MNVLFHTIPIGLIQLLSQNAPPCCFLSLIWLSRCFTCPLCKSSPLMPWPSCSLLFCRYPLTNFPLRLTFLLPIPYQQPSHSLYLPLYTWWEAGVVFLAYLFISSLLLCCRAVEMVRVQRVLSSDEGGWEMGKMPAKDETHYANREKWQTIQISVLKQLCISQWMRKTNINFS